MKFLVVVTPPSIYHGCSTRKTFWEEKFTGNKYLFQFVNMKNCGRRKVSKHKEIRTRLNQFEILENMKTVYQDENDFFLDENTVERKPCINREIKSFEITI